MDPPHHGRRAAAVPEKRATRSPAAACVRLAGLADIPAIARLAHDARDDSADEPEAIARARRLLLAQVAFEHGALWIETLPGEPAPVRAVTAIPGRPVGPGQSGIPSRPVLQQILRRFADPASSASPSSEPDEALLRALETIDCAWIISELSRAQDADGADPELLTAAFAWAQDRGRAHRDRVAVLAGSEVGRVAALSLGFTPFAESTSTNSWWLGVKATGTPHDSAFDRPTGHADGHRSVSESTGRGR